MSLACLLAFALSGCGSSAGAASHRSASRSETFTYNGLAFNYPPAWQAVHYEATSSFTHLITYLSDQPLHSPCTSHKVLGGTEVDCAAPLDRLAPGHVLITWRAEGFLSEPGTGPKVNTAIGGHPARLDHGTRLDMCTSIGATAEINAVISSDAKAAATLEGNNVSMYACFDAKDRLLVEPQVRQMLASVRFTD